MGAKKRSLEYRINENGCFLVTSHRLNRDGYCYVWHMNYEYRAHRLIYQECFGEIPKGLVVRHKCDTRNCINPEHLELGTPRDNNMDCISRGRSRNVVGEKNGSSKITEDEARKIKLMVKEGKMPLEIARTLNISLNIARRIKELKTWKHVVV